MKYFKTVFLTGWMGLSGLFVWAQEKPGENQENKKKTNKDTSQVKEIVVTGYGSNRKLIETPASIIPITQKDLVKFSGTSLIPVLDQAPGVDFQERSPGNYRLSIRGSTLRAAFNVRNVKIYWDDIPYTDGGGTSWLTPLDLHSMGSLEIIKGPTGSAYGAGSGGTLLIRSKLPQDTGLHYALDANAGSFGMQGLNVAISTKSIQNASYLNYSMLKADGYRENSGIDRQMIHLSSQFFLTPRDVLTLSTFYTDLHYQTPYSLNLKQYTSDPKQSRPATSTAPAVILQRTGESIRKFFLGASNHYTWNEHFDNITSIGLTPDQIQNTSPLNIEKTEEENFSFRTQTRYSFTLGNIKGRLAAGGEYITSFQSDRNYGNLKGIPDSILSDDQLNNIQWIIFSSLELNLPKNLYLNLGASLNKVSYTIQRLDYSPSFILQTNFLPIVSPRIAVQEKFLPNQSLYMGFSYGYSPPASSEVLPSTGIFNATLQAEISRDLELGYRGSFWNHLIDLDLTLFYNQINHSIIRRSDSLGQDFYLNNGSSVEKGIEGLFRFSPIQSLNKAFSYLSFYSNFTINNFYFKEYILNGANLSGNPFTGVAPYVVVSGIDARILNGFYANINYHYSDKISLNDQNTVKSMAYSIFGGKAGYSRKIGKRFMMDLNMGVDNVFNKRYSLGNDINATGGRYYNPAPIRNYFLGMSLKY